MEDVENEISCFCVAHDIPPRHILMNVSMCGLGWVLEDLSSKIYLSEKTINDIREKIKVLYIFSSVYRTTFEILSCIEKTNDVGKKLELWESYYTTLIGLSPKLEKYVVCSNNAFVKKQFLLESVNHNALQML
jgi:hypothetical protein